MAKVKIQGHASGTGVLTVTAPNTSTDRTITLPDATATIATTTDVAARLPSITDGGNATAITIDSSENVGIGASPSGGKLVITGTGAPQLKLTEDGEPKFQITLSGTTTTLEAASGGSESTAIAFKTSSSGTEAERMRILSSGGITFNGDTAAANALDDYEEGTWTPAYTAHGNTNPTISYTSRHGFYRKIGNIVHATCSINTASVSGGNSGHHLELSGLPFAAYHNAAGNVIRPRTQNWNTSIDCPVSGYIDASSTHAWLQKREADTSHAHTTVKTSDLRTSGDSNQLNCQVVYFTQP